MPAAEVAVPPTEVAMSPQYAGHYLENNKRMREIVDDEVAACANDDEKTAIIEEEKRRVVDGEEGAERAADAASIANVSSRSHGFEVVPNAQMADAQYARQAITRLFHIVRKGATRDIQIERTVIPESSQKLLAALDSKFQNSLDDTTAVILYPLITKALSHNLTREELEQEFKAIKGRLHPTTSKKISSAIIEQRDMYGMSEDEAKQVFKADESPLLREIRGERKAPLSMKERQNYQSILDDIDALSFEGESTQAIAQKKHELWKAVNGGNREEVKRILTGWNDAKIDDLLRFSRQEEQNGDMDALREYGIQPEDVMILNSKYIETHFNDFFELKDGHYFLIPEKVDEMIEAIYHATNNITAGARANPESDWRDNFNDLQEGRAVRELRKILYATAENDNIHRLLVDEKSRYAFRDSCYAIASEIDFEISAREALHTIRNVILGGKVGPEEIAKFVKGKFPASRFALILSGYDGEMVEIARAISVRHTSWELRKENGMPPDLFASHFERGTRMTQPDQRTIRDDLIKTFDKLKGDEELRDKNNRLYTQLDKPLTPWRVERVMALGMAVSLVGDMRIVEELATAAANSTFTGGLASWMGPFGYLSRILRGQESYFGYRGILYTNVPQTEAQYKSRRKAGHDNVQNKVRYFQNPGSMSESTRKAYELKFSGVSAETKTGIPFINLIRDFITYSWIQQASWRTGALKAWYEENYNGKSLGGTPAEWREAYENLGSEVGVGILWTFDKPRVEAEAKDYAMRRTYGDYKKNFTQKEIDARWGRLKKRTKYGAVGTRLSYEEFEREKIRCYEAMNMQGVLMRSPFDTMLNMITLESEVLVTKKIDTSDPKKKLLISAYDFYFGDAGKLTLAQRKERDLYVKKLEQKWGADNVPHIRRFMETWHNIYARYASFTKDGELTIAVVDQAREETYHIMTAAAESVKMKKKVHMTREDIVSSDSEGKDDPKSSTQKFFAREFLMEEGGLQHYFIKLDEKFGDKEGQEGSLGDKKFFYTFAVRWFDIEQRRIIPSTSEVRMQPIFEYVHKVGEDVVARQWEGAKPSEDVIKEFSNLGDTFEALANGNPKQLEELQEKIKTLAGKEGSEGMYKLQAAVAMLRSEFLQSTGHAAINPFWNERQSSESKAVFGINSYDETSEQMRLKFHEMVKKGVLTEKLAKTMMHSLGIDTKTYLLTEAGPMMLLFIIAWILMNNLKTAYEQEMEQKKAA